MGDVVCLFSGKVVAHNTVVPVELTMEDVLPGEYFDGYDSLVDKLQIIAGKMAEELCEYPSGIPASVVKYNEALMQHVANIHADELDDGYNSVAEFITDLVQWHDERVEDIIQHSIDQQYSSRLRVLK